MRISSARGPRLIQTGGALPASSGSCQGCVVMTQTAGRMDAARRETERYPRQVCATRRLDDGGVTDGGSREAIVARGGQIPSIEQTYAVSQKWPGRRAVVMSLSRLGTQTISLSRRSTGISLRSVGIRRTPGTARSSTATTRCSVPTRPAARFGGSSSARMPVRLPVSSPHRTRERCSSGFSTVVSLPAGITPPTAATPRRSAHGRMAMRGRPR